MRVSDPAARPAHRVYADAAGTAPPLPVAVRAHAAALAEGWADPRRLHHEGRTARLLLEGARETIAACLGARTEEIVLTASHVRAVHAAVLGAAAAGRRRGAGTVCSAVEHSAVLHAADHVARAAAEPGHADTETADGERADTETAVRVPVDPDGRVVVEEFRTALGRDGVVLAALQHANGEVGTLQPVEEIRALARAAGVPLLVDAAASIGHTTPPRSWDLLTADPRGWGGVPGVGVLAVRAGTRWRSPGPDHDGTERLPDDVDVPAALAAAAALQEITAGPLAAPGPDPRRALVARIREAAARIPDTEVVGDPEDRLPHVVTFSCLYVDGEQLLERLDHAGFAVGSGSACTASTLEPSHVLAAMGVLTHGNVRIGLPRGITAEDVDRLCGALPTAVAEVRALLGAEGL